MSALTLPQTKIRLDATTVVGACKLELAKLEMNKLQQVVKKPNFNCHLLNSETDSIMYENKFDIFNYSSHHFLLNAANQFTVLKLKTSPG